MAITLKVLHMAWFPINSCYCTFVQRKHSPASAKDVQCFPPSFWILFYWKQATGFRMDTSLLPVVPYSVFLPQRPSKVLDSWAWAGGLHAISVPLVSYFISDEAARSIIHTDLTGLLYSLTCTSFFSLRTTMSCCGCCVFLNKCFEISVQIFWYICAVWELSRA